MMTPDMKNIHQRLHAAQADVDYVQKEKKSGMNYSIVTHDAVTAKVRPVLHKHGIVYYPTTLDVVQDGNRTQVKLTVRFANVDEPADAIDVPSLGYGIDAQDKGPGKAISYAVKYALLKALGLETGDDPDEASVPHQPAPAKAAPATKPTASAANPTQRELGSDPSDWTIIADDIIKEARTGRTGAMVDRIIHEYKPQLAKMPAAEVARIKAEVTKHREAIAALHP